MPLEVSDWARELLESHIMLYPVGERRSGTFQARHVEDLARRVDDNDGIRKLAWPAAAGYSKGGHERAR